MKNKLIILCGISNSGKSTWAHKQVMKNPARTVRVSRDKIREGIYGYTEETVKEYYNDPLIRDMEGQVTEVEENLVEYFLDKGKNVIVDATHLSCKRLNRFDQFSIDNIEIVFFDITLKEALTRNRTRKRQVDEQVIISQYDKYVDFRKTLATQKLKFDYICREINN